MIYNVVTKMTMWALMTRNVHSEIKAGSEANCILSLISVKMQIDLYIQQNVLSGCCLSGAMLRAGAAAMNKINIVYREVTSPLTILCR